MSFSGPRVSGPVAGLAVRRSGSDGPRVLWIHGYTLNSALWLPLWERLPGRAHIAVDLPGHGRSAPLRPDEDLRSLGARLAEWARSEGVCHLVGLSLGSTIALEVAMSAPMLFETLTLGAPAIGGGPVEASVGQRFAELRRMEVQLGRGPWLAERWMSSPPDLFTEARKNPPLWMAIDAAVRAHAFDELPGYAIARLATPRQSPAKIATIGCRVLLVMGEREMPAFRQTAAMLSALCKGACHQVLPGAGHLCLLEAPGKIAPLLARHWADDNSLPAKF